jgi:hypothetical protein
MVSVALSAQSEVVAASGGDRGFELPVGRVVVPLVVHAESPFRQPGTDDHRCRGGRVASVLGVAEVPSVA